MERLRFSTFNLIEFLLISCFLFPVIVCAQDKNLDISAVSSNSLFRVSFESKKEPIPLNQIHQWVLHIEDMEGQPVEKANVLVDGGMPAHNHGLPTQPTVTEIGNGDYLVEGIKFSMTGLWEMLFYVQTDAATDQVKFELEF